MRTITKYESNRGREFSTEAEALRDDAAEDFENFVENSYDYDSRGMSGADIVVWLINNREAVLEFLK